LALQSKGVFPAAELESALVPLSVALPIQSLIPAIVAVDLAKSSVVLVS
jgi:hypothetical protein